MEVWTARQVKMAEMQRIKEKRNLEAKLADDERDLKVKCANDKERVDLNHINNMYHQALRNVVTNHFNSLIGSRSLVLNYEVSCKMKQAAQDRCEFLLRSERGENELVAALENNNFDLLTRSFFKGDDLSRVLDEVYTYRSFQDADAFKGELSENASYMMGISSYGEASYSSHSQEQKQASESRFKRGRSEFSEDDDD